MLALTQSEWQDPPLNQGDILLVDDVLENLQILSAMLEAEGYEVRQALNGQMALMGIEAELPDLILLDVRMPGLDGYTVCQ
ncbi:response regulator [Synechococcus sp. Nb3U1]|uniref:response regulator n=1 Tax=Synechococcus sp. Nb3U1 TaxID=1914529 RepID=UPI001F2EE0B4|nr:response regulator [Synechococcus sp. Nb3U1]MCF2971115.1 response regulator [Synechococcus sp. Nb3U1]